MLGTGEESTDRTVRFWMDVRGGERMGDEEEEEEGEEEKEEEDEGREEEEEEEEEKESEEIVRQVGQHALTRSHLSMHLWWKR